MAEQERLYRLQQKQYQQQMRQQQRQENAVIRQQNKIIKQEQRQQEKRDQNRARIESIVNNCVLTPSDFMTLGFSPSVVQATAEILRRAALQGCREPNAQVVCDIVRNVYHVDLTKQTTLAGQIMYMIQIQRRDLQYKLSSALSVVKNKAVRNSGDTEAENACLVLARHYTRMYREFGVGRAKINNTGIKKLNEIHKIPKRLYIAGIADPIFNIYNSDRYIDKNEKFYLMEGSNNQYIHIVTDKRPVLRRGQEAKVQGVGIIREAPYGSVEADNVYINRKYIRQLSRYAVYVSTKKPALHCGLIQLVCVGGTIIYVYALEVGDTDLVNRSEGGKKVYSYGYFRNNLYNSVKNVAMCIGNEYGACFSVTYRPQHEYKETLIPLIQNGQ